MNLKTKAKGNKRNMAYSVQANGTIGAPVPATNASTKPQRFEKHDLSSAFPFGRIQTVPPITDSICWKLSDCIINLLIIKLKKN